MNILDTPFTHSDDEIIQTGPDKGKTVAQLRAEIFDSNISDLDYFISRCKHHGITPLQHDS